MKKIAIVAVAAAFVIPSVSFAHGHGHRSQPPAIAVGLSAAFTAPPTVLDINVGKDACSPAINTGSASLAGSEGGDVRIGDCSVVTINALPETSKLSNVSVAATAGSVASISTSSTAKGVTNAAGVATRDPGRHLDVHTSGYGQLDHFSSSVLLK